MMKKRLFFALLCLSGSLNAAPLQGISFSHHNWEVVCDNTGTCRVAGYQDYGDHRAVSVLFTRAAGENAPIKGRIALVQPENVPISDIRLVLNNQSLGSLKLDNDGYGQLSPQQTQTLLQSLKYQNKIRILSGKYEWEISDKGASAVLLKADEFQRRLNTPNAWLKRGNSTHPVLQPQAKPQIRAAKVPQTGHFTLKSGAKNHRQVLDLLRAANKKQGEQEECFHLQSDEHGFKLDINVYPLSQDKKLVGVLCAMGAYQASMFYAITNKSLSRVDEILPNEYGGLSDYDPETGELHGSFKGRGLGDCWYFQTAVWNGRTFVKTEISGSELCRGFAGGAWSMPKLVSDVIRVK
ncbi:DUF1176 domain-containing protein [Wielerella bovis]|uniref:DUF1176 domain-containing protein n=1 Tax=Wielerella bovis TaxID=2917790 RepID=UPI0020190B0C|nr:DUF1176 domain-containing protein [Wielerella bovis]ULJ69193.1 DUF1176 domain-containing protein [Wielerella bovis]